MEWVKIMHRKPYEFLKTFPFNVFLFANKRS